MHSNSLYSMYQVIFLFLFLFYHHRLSPHFSCSLISLLHILKILILSSFTFPFLSILLLHFLHYYHTFDMILLYFRLLFTLSFSPGSFILHFLNFSSSVFISFSPFSITACAFVTSEYERLIFGSFYIFYNGQRHKNRLQKK